MTWLKVDDQLALHRKTRAAGNTAMGLWVRAGSLCAAQLDDGHVDSDVPGLLGGKRADAIRLVSAGLWHGAGHACAACPQPRAPLPFAGTAGPGSRGGEWTWQPAGQRA